MLPKETSNLKPDQVVCSNDIQIKILKYFENIFAAFI